MNMLKGLPVANAINEQIAQEMKDWKGASPHLAIIRVGEKQDDIAYERGAVKKMEKVGFACTTYVLPADVDNDTFLQKFDEINESRDIDGILLLRPLPRHLDEKAVESPTAPVAKLGRTLWVKALIAVFLLTMAMHIFWLLATNPI